MPVEGSRTKFKLGGLKLDGVTHDPSIEVDDSWMLRFRSSVFTKERKKTTPKSRKVVSKEQASEIMAEIDGVMKEVDEVMEEVDETVTADGDAEDEVEVT